MMANNLAAVAGQAGAWSTVTGYVYAFEHTAWSYEYLCRHAGWCHDTQKISTCQVDCLTYMTVIYVAEGSATKMHIPWKFCAFTGSGFTVGEGGWGEGIYFWWFIHSEN